MKNDTEEPFVFRRDSELRHSTGSMKGSKKMEVNLKTRSATDDTDALPSVTNMIKNINNKISHNRQSVKTSQPTNSEKDFQTPGYVVDAPFDRQKNTSTRRKLSLRKKGKLSDEENRHTIYQQHGILTSYLGYENRPIERSFAYFDVQSLFFSFQTAATLKCNYDSGSAYTHKKTGASAASSAGNKTRTQTDSIVDDGDEQGNHLLLSCPFFRNEIAVLEVSDDENKTKDTRETRGKDISKLINMFNRNRSLENLRHDRFNIDKRYSRRRQLESSQQDIILEKIDEGSCFLTWDEPNVAGKQIFDFEHIDRGAMFYREYFYGKDHVNLFGIDEKYGPVAISIIREVLTKSAVLGRDNEGNEKNNSKKHQYKIIVRTCDLICLRVSVLEASINSTSRHNASRAIPLKDVLETCFPEIQTSCLKHGLQVQKTWEQLLKLDEQKLALAYKIGLLYCKSGQKTEEEMYNNEHGGSEFLEFCSVIADKVALKGFQGYRAQLDNKNNSTGQHSLYTTFHGREIMFHVSTELPFTAHDRQQLLRKRHIGNDIVTVIFQAPGSEPFTPQVMRSHFQHVFIIVRVLNPHTEFTKYEVAVTRSKDVPYFGPPIPPDKFDKSPAFREFLLSKLINAENAAYKSEKFTTMAKRTRYGYLEDLAQNHVSAQTLETPNKFGFSFSTKRKEKSKGSQVHPEIFLQGALVWTVKFDFQDNAAGVNAFLAVSTKCVTFVDQNTQEILATIPCKSVLGWRTTSHTLKLFYDSGKMVYCTMSGDDQNDLPYVVNRLKLVTPGCETLDLTLRRNHDGQLGFHVYYEGLVAEVEPYGLAWNAGLRKGSRLLEISGYCVCKMSHERMILMLKRPGAVRIVVLPPAPDGHPRNYKAVRRLRRFSSMTSVYSMGFNNSKEFGDESPPSSNLNSSKENLRNSVEIPDHPLSVPDFTTKIRSKSVEGQLPRSESIESDTSEKPVKLTKQIPTIVSPRDIASIKDFNSQERIIQSRSATDIASAVAAPKEGKSSRRLITSPPPIAPKPGKVTSPQNTLDQEWGDLERNLTDTRRSIDAKFYKSLANSQSPFFSRPSRVPGLLSPEESGDADDVLTCANIVGTTNTTTTVTTTTNATSGETKNMALLFTKRGNDLQYPIVNERLNIKLSKDSIKFSKIGSPTSTSPGFASPTSPTFKGFPRLISSENTKEIKSPIKSIHPPFLNHLNSNDFKKSQLTKESDLQRNQAQEKTRTVDSSMHKNMDQVKDTDRGKDSENLSDSSMHSRTRSQEGFTSEKDSDSTKKGSIVKTKVRDAKEIINERIRHSPQMNRRNNFTKCSSLDTVPKAIIKTGVSVAARKQLFGGENEPPRSSSPSQSPKVNIPASVPRKGSDPISRIRKDQSQIASHDDGRTSAPVFTSRQIHSSQLRDDEPGKSPDNIVKLDASLCETFAKIESAFGFKPTTITNPSVTLREDKPRKKRKQKRRSRNFEPPSSDSSDEYIKTGRNSVRSSRSPFGLEEFNRAPKSEAEESLEAAISDFQLSLKSMPRESSHSRQVSNDTTTYSSMKSSPDEPKVFPFSSISTSIHNHIYNDGNPPKVPERTSSPQILDDFKKFRLRKSESEGLSDRSQKLKTDTKRLCSEGHSLQKENHGIESPNSRANASLTSLRPWAPPLRKLDSSENILKNVKEAQWNGKPPNLDLAKDFSLSKEDVFIKEDRHEVARSDDQLSPLPDISNSSVNPGMHSLPNRGAKRRGTVNSDQMSKTNSATCIPLVVRGLDLAANKECPLTGTWSKDDLHVMLTVMENELEQEREEKERLALELNRSREEKERLLHQSKQAASQLRKFTALFLETTPEDLERAKENYTANR